MWLQYDEEKGMGCLWCVEDKETLVAQNFLNSNRFIDGCNSYKNGVDFIVIWHPICLLLQASYIRIILEIATFITYLPVELIFETSQFGFKDLSFSTR